MRTLVIDDEEELVTTLVERLEIRGIDAVGVGTGREALEVLKREHFDVVVLDVRLRGEDGISVMKGIKSIQSDMPVLLVTGHMSESSSKEGLKAGAIDYLIKPIDIDVLVQRLQEAVLLYPRRSSDDG